MTQEILRTAADEFNTPVYLFDLDLFRDRIMETKEVLGETFPLCYAMKANPFLTGKAAEWVGKIEVCSPGELKICKSLKIPMSRIILSGVLKEENDLLSVFQSEEELPLFTAESFGQAGRIGELARKYGRMAQILLRLTSGNQFGMDKEELIFAVELLKKNENIMIRGIHFYSGTQKKKIVQIKKELEELDAFCMEISEKTGVSIGLLEYGPGIGIEYFQKEKAQSKEETDESHKMLAEIRDAAKDLKFGGQVTFEMGRYLAALCGYFVTKVREVKNNQGVNYCLVDGGLHHINYDGQVMAMKTPYCRQIPVRAEKEEEKYNICGSLCTVNDVLIRQYPLREIQPGDLLVFERTGAYSMTEGMSLFLSRDLPAAACYSRTEGMKLLREGTPVYMLNMEKAVCGQAGD